jgi:hypothetical protein
MVKLHFETLAPGMKAKLDSPHRAQHADRAAHTRNAIRRQRHGSINCILADAVKMPYNRTQA